MHVCVSVWEYVHPCIWSYRLLSTAQSEWVPRTKLRISAKDVHALNHRAIFSSHPSSFVGSTCHVYVGVHSGQKRALYPLELGMQTVVSCSVMVLGRAQALVNTVISPVLPFYWVRVIIKWLVWLACRLYSPSVCYFSSITGGVRGTNNPQLTSLWMLRIRTSVLMPEQHTSTLPTYPSQPLCSSQKFISKAFVWSYKSQRVDAEGRNWRIKVLSI